MRSSELEAWILSVVETTTLGQLPEDSRVELKAKWPDPKKAARRLGGHANSCQSDYVLWIIGLQEGAGVIPFEPVDLASWFSELRRQFDGIAPDVQDLVVPTSTGPVVGLLFSTIRRPFVVVNPSFGSVSGAVIEREVPWREGTRVRSAQRADLIKILTSSIVLPHLEVLRIGIRHENLAGRERSPGTHLQEIQYEPHFAWTVSLSIYVTPRHPDLLVFPVHRSTLLLKTSDSTKRMSRLQYHIQHLRHGSGSATVDSRTISRTSTEALIEGPGVLEVSGELYEQPYDYQPDEIINVQFCVRPAGSENRVYAEISANQTKSASKDKENVTWWRCQPEYHE